jgi:hypothetical protein
VDESTKSVLRAVAEACRRIGSANDLEDRGDPGGARALREDAQRAIAEALGAASEDDRERVSCLFGPELPSRCDARTWHTVDHYAHYLIDRDPELPVAALRQRHAAFVGQIEQLRDATDALEARLPMRYARRGRPWMPNVFRAFLQRTGEPLGSYSIAPVSYNLDLAGNGMRCELRRSGPEPCDVLIGGVLVHVELDPTTTPTGTVVSLRSLDREALERAAADLHAALAADGWEEIPG